MDEVYKLQADVLKTLSNPRRLEIIHLLADGPREVGRLAAEMSISQPNVSQHLALMRSAGLVDVSFRRLGLGAVALHVGRAPAIGVPGG